MPNSHAELSASGAHRWINCPGSVALSRKVPPPKTSVYAAEGSVAHAIAEQALKDALEHPTELLRLPERLGEAITQEGHKITVSREMISTVQTYIRALQEHINFTLQGERTIAIEKRVSPKLDGRDHGLYGTADVIVRDIKNKFIYVIDFKYGKGIPVNACNNAQLRYYGLGALAAFNIDEADEKWHIGLSIVQPRSDHQDNTIKQSEGLSTKDLYRWGRDVLLPAVQLTKQKDAPFKTGDWCRFCPAKSICELKKQEGKDLMQQLMEGNPVTTHSVKTNTMTTRPVTTHSTPVTATPVTSTPTHSTKESILLPLILPTPELLTVEELSEILTRGEKWLAACKALALEKAKNNEDIPGFALQPRQGHRRWVSEEKLIEALAPLYGDLLYQKTLKTPAKMEKVVDEKLLLPYIERPDLGETLKPCAKAVTAAEAFSEN